MRTVIILLISLGALLAPYHTAPSLLDAAEANPAAQPNVGHNKGLKVDGGAAWTYDLFVPSSYPQEPDKRFPVLYLSSPNANPGTFDLHDWAESRGVLIVSINDSKNGMSYDEIGRIQEAIIATVTSRYRTHPHLNMASGISGGANASLALVNRHPNMFCGILLQCMSGTPAASHLAVGWIHGAKDEVLGVGGVWRGYDRLKSTGRATITVNRSRKHTPGSKDEKERAVEHALWWGRLTHPRIDREERTYYYQMLNNAMEQAISITDYQQRIQRSEFLASLPNANQAPNFGALVESWAAARMARIEAETESGPRLLQLQDLGQHPLAKGLSREVQNRCRELLATLRRDQAAQIWVTASRRFDELFEMEQRAGLNRSAIEATRRGFAELAEALGEEHPIGKNAANNAQRLDRHLANP